MNYTAKILYQVKYVDSLLELYDEKPMFDNIFFKVDEVSWEEYLKISFIKEGCIRFDLIFSSSEFQINIDRANEALDIDSNSFDSNKEIIKYFFRYLFVCRSKVEYCGANYTKIFFYDNKGSCVKTLKYVTGLFVKVGCITKEYPPVYNV